ncbi:hypothetical protein M422DRAFT_778732 [Sphaerobolus stellatus SS14]|uniref:Unplaced genomic scaffold SPHSTscaffold_36, whole genome shotgun sequence n=1 Tax=Sphaerobolus stellatus (strain SS14) TaxID=990650 RepID=A0A0C9W350_SPHS4|nr:hypothetical protein M422DRAFT_778732 [Sphaerobolus stellatus SS14]
MEASQKPSNSNKLIIIGVCVGFGSVLVLFVVYRVWRCVRAPKQPLPPKQALVFQQHPATTARFPEPSFLRAPVASSSRTPYQSLVPFDGSITDISSHRHSPSMVSSQTPLIPFPEGSEENAERSRPGLPSLDSSASTNRHQSRQRARTASGAGSIRSLHSHHSGHGVRPPPHRRPLNIVLPPPLAPGLVNSSTNVSVASFDRFSEPRDNTSELGSPYVPPPTIRQSPHRHRRAATAVSPPTIPPLPTGVYTHSPRSLSVDERPRRKLKAKSKEPLDDPPDSPNYGPPPLPPPKDPGMMLLPRKRPPQ